MDKLQTLLSNYFTVSDLSVDERRKRIFLSLCIGISVPFITIYSIVDFLQGQIVESLVVLAASAVLITVQILFRRVQDMTASFRLSAALILLLMIFELAIGGGEGFVFLWFYLLPILLFFIFGKVEGLIWVLASFATIILFMFLDIGHYHYSHIVSLRFFVTYLIVTIISYALEASRHYFYTQLLNEKKSLEAALERVNTLSGLLPICSVCKKIRDDKGYWNQIEKYIHQHSQAEFSHGICPECARQLYPDIDLAEENQPDDPDDKENQE